MQISHVAMYVKDIEAAKKFFQTFLEGHPNKLYHNKSTGFSSYFISFDSGTKLEIMSKPEITDEDKNINRTGYSHIAFSVGNREKVNEITEKLNAAGYRILSGPRITGDGFYESCIISIEDNLIEITI